MINLLLLVGASIIASLLIIKLLSIAVYFVILTSAKPALERHLILVSKEERE